MLSTKDGKGTAHDVSKHFRATLVTDSDQISSTVPWFQGRLRCSGVCCSMFLEQEISRLLFTRSQESTLLKTSKAAKTSLDLRLLTKMSGKSSKHILPHPGFFPWWFTSWWFQPIWKILVKMDHYPNFLGENKKCLKPPTSLPWVKLKKKHLKYKSKHLKSKRSKKLRSDLRKSNKWELSKKSWDVHHFFVMKNYPPKSGWWHRDKHRIILSETKKRLKKQSQTNTPEETNGPGIPPQKMEAFGSIGVDVLFQTFSGSVPMSRIHGTNGIFTYIDPIKIKHSCRLIYRSSHGSCG